MLIYVCSIDDTKIFEDQTITQLIRFYFISCQFIPSGTRDNLIWFYSQDVPRNISENGLFLVCGATLYTPLCGLQIIALRGNYVDGQGSKHRQGKKQIIKKV